MSIVIIGGNECMERDYLNLCKEHGCNAKVFCKYKSCMKDRIGNPDLMILFTHTDTSSKASLKSILSTYAQA